VPDSQVLDFLQSPADPLPQPEDDYVACGRVSNKPEAMLCLIRRDQSYELFPYGNLVRARLASLPSPGAGRMLRLRFLGAGVTDVRIEGRSLLDLMHDLQRHRIPWLREVPTDRPFLDRKGLVITRIAVERAGAEEW